jgi:MFS family permease
MTRLGLTPMRAQGVALAPQNAIKQRCARARNSYRRRVLSALRSRNFRLLWLSQSASVIGDGLVIVAVGLFVTRLTGNPSDVGLVLTAYVVPLVLLLLVGGVIADRLPRQAVMVVSDTARCVLHGTLALLIATDAVRMWHMVVIGLLYGAAQAFFQPAYTGLIPQTVEEGDIQSAQALGGISREVASFLSPAIATALIFSVGGAAAFGLDAATFAVSAMTLSRVRARDRGGEHVSATVLAELKDGWAAVRERPWVWASISAFSAALLVALAPFWVLGPAVSREVYGTEATFGIASVFWGVGTVTGAVAGGHWHPRRPMLTAVSVGFAWPLQIALFAFGPPLAVLYAVTTLSGIGIGLLGVWWETALAQRIPPQLLSRVSAWDWMGSLALLPVGYLLAGPFSDTFGQVRVLEVGGVVGTAIMALAFLPHSTRTMTRFDVSSIAAAISPVIVPTIER